MTTKTELINGAYTLMRISGLTVDPSSEDLALALIRLEDMAEEFHGRNIKTDYNFEVTPNVNSVHNLPRRFWFAYKANLAVRLLPDFGKQPNPALITMQRTSFSFLSAATALIKRTKYPSRMPVGQTNSRYANRWSRFFKYEAEAPLESETIVMYIDDVKAFSESFVAYLDAAETIASYTITADTGLTITTDANATPLITYTIQADGLADGGDVGLLEVKIVVTTSAGRIETRIINFSLLSSDIT